MIRCELKSSGSCKVEFLKEEGSKGEDTLARELQAILKGLKNTLMESNENFKDEAGVNATLLHVCATALYSGQEIRMKSKKKREV